MNFITDCFKYDSKKQVCGLTPNLIALYINNYFEHNDENVLVLTSNLYGYIITIIANKKFKLGLLKYHLENIVNFLSISLDPYKDVLLSIGSNISLKPNISLF